MKRIRVKHDEKNPTSKEVLAESIVKIGEAMDALKKSGLNEKAIIVLLNHKTKVSQSDIRAVLDGMRQLRKWYCS